jgi:hypothetical protein
MNINRIEITNVKGISKKSFQLDLNPNKPNILVAPNGFGKSSFALAFDRLRRDKIELNDKEYHNKDITNRPQLKITLSNGTELIADDNRNAISGMFDVVVIKNQTEPKSVVQTIPGRPTFARTSLDIIKTTLIQTIPPKVDFTYNSANMKANFGTNGNKILTNISRLFNSSRFIYTIESSIDFSRFDLLAFKKIIESIIDQINHQSGTRNQIKIWIVDNLLDELKKHDEFSKFADIIQSYGFEVLNDEVDYYLTAWQLITVRNEMGTDFRKACKHLYFLDKKQHYTETIANYNPVKDRFDIKPIIEGNSLVVNWPKAHEISNGQRDILTFIALLIKTRNSFKKKDCILIIDEIFDYLDDANLITFQYYISTFIEDMKANKRRIFPILLTHLDPLFFNHFCFNENKIKVCYIKDIKVKANQQILNIIYNRQNDTIKDIVDAHYFHFHPDSGEINITEEFKALKLNLDWGTPDKFFKKIFREVRRYLVDDETFDALAICFGVRNRIEQLVYDKIPDDEYKRKFIEENKGTRNKLHFAQSIGVQIPETYFLLGIIYNTSLHLSQGQDISKPLGLKLENGTIKQMIMNLWKL